MANESLIDRIRQGDMESLAEWLQEQRPRLLSVAAREMSDGLRKKVEPDDILQEVSADAVRSLGEVDLAGKDPFPWICELIRRRVIDAHRFHFEAQKRAGDKEVAIDAQRPGSTWSPGLIDMIVSSITSPSAAFSRNQKEFRLAAAISELGEAQRKALQLRYVEGKSTAEVAKALDKSSGAVRVLLSRTVQQLRDVLASPDDTHRH